jgi:hypothetical protein
MPMVLGRPSDPWETCRLRGILVAFEKTPRIFADVPVAFEKIPEVPLLQTSIPFTPIPDLRHCCVLTLRGFSTESCP